MKDINNTRIFIVFPYSGLNDVASMKDCKILHNVDEATQCDKCIALIEWEPGVFAALKELNLPCAVVYPKGDMQDEWIGRAYRNQDTNVASKFSTVWEDLMAEIQTKCEQYEFQQYRLEHFQNVCDVLRILPFVNDYAAPGLFSHGISEVDLQNIQICVDELITATPDATEIWLTGPTVGGTDSHEAQYGFVVVKDAEDTQCWRPMSEFLLEERVYNTFGRHIDTHVTGYSAHELQHNPYLTNERNHHVVVFKQTE